MEEIFFFQYHLRMGQAQCLQIPVNERKWIIERFIKQKIVKTKRWKQLEEKLKNKVS